MFEELMRELRRMARGDQVTVSIETDPDGYIDQVCPSQGCEFRFKIHMDDRDEKVSDNAMFCPFCGHTDNTQEWFTQEQKKYFESAMLTHVDKRITRAMKNDARHSNRQQPKGGFLHLTMSVNSPPKLIALPPTATEPMRTKITCSKCFCRYAVIGAAFFCPACGQNDAKQIFHLSLNGRLKTLDQIPKLRAESSDRDAAENMVHALVEHTLQHAISAFQKYAEALCQDFPNPKELQQNAFQNLKGGSNLWQSATNKQYSDYLDESELATLTIAFQRRHLFAHRQGLVDQKYIDRSGDTCYQLGQRVVLHENNVREYVALIRKLGSCMEKTAQENKDEL